MKGDLDMLISNKRSDANCTQCPYRLGIIEAVICPCPQCRLNSHGIFGRFIGAFEKKYESRGKRKNNA